MAKIKTIKVVIIGDKGVGKSCLLHRYLNDIFVTQSKPTCVAMYLQKEIQISLSRYHQQTVNFQIWEIADSAHFLNTTSLVYRHANIYLLAFDLTDKKSFDRIPYYYQKIKKQVLHPHVILLATKCDLVKQRKVSLADIKKMEQRFNTFCIHSSAESGENIHAIFTLAARSFFQTKLITNKILFECTTFFHRHWPKLLLGGAMVGVITLIAILTGGFFLVAAAGLITLGVVVPSSTVMMGLIFLSLLGMSAGIMMGVAYLAGHFRKTTNPSHLLEKNEGMNTARIDMCLSEGHNSFNLQKQKIGHIPPSRFASRMLKYSPGLSIFLSTSRGFAFEAPQSLCEPVEGRMFSTRHCRIP